MYSEKENKFVKIKGKYKKKEGGMKIIGKFLARYKYTKKDNKYLCKKSYSPITNKLTGKEIGVKMSKYSCWKATLENWLLTESSEPIKTELGENLLVE